MLPKAFGHMYLFCLGTGCHLYDNALSSLTLILAELGDNAIKVLS
jgi:hypothetical protein